LPETQFQRKYFAATEEQLFDSSTKSPEEKDATSDTVRTDSTTETQTISPPKKTYLQELKPWSKVNPESGYFHLLVRPWPLLVYPATIFSFLTFASTLGWYLCVLTTYASVFQAPPYNMSPGVSSLINIPGVIGNLIGAYCGGGLTDKIAERMARKNNGVFEPETRLIALILPAILVPTGLLMCVNFFLTNIRYGMGVQHQTSWVVPFLGFGFVCFGLTAIPTITMTYGNFYDSWLMIVLDSYYPVAYESFLLIAGLKNVFSFGFSFAIVPWVTLSGFQGAFGTMVGVQCALMLFGVPLWYYGKKIRHKSAGWRVIY
jgi:hypothetical protein